MFRSSHLRKAFSSLDFTHALAEQGVVSPSQLGYFGLEDGKIQALAWDSVQSLLAIGTANGCLAIVGAQGVILTFSLRPALAVKYLVFRSGTSQLCCIDARDTLSVFDVAVLDGESRPTRSLAWSARSTVTAIDCSPAHSMLILGLRDGTVDFYDLDRGHPSALLSSLVGTS